VHAAGENALNAVAQRAGNHRHLSPEGKSLRGEPKQALGSQQDHDAEKAKDEAQELAPAQRLVGQKKMRKQRHTERHHGHEDARQARGDVFYTPGDEQEGNDIADDRYGEKTRPELQVHREPPAEEDKKTAQGCTGDDETQSHHPDRRNGGDCDFEKRKRASPEHHDGNQQKPSERNGRLHRLALIQIGTIRRLSLASTNQSNKLGRL